MKHTPAHNFNREFQEGVTTGKIEMARHILDIVYGWQDHEEMRELIWLLRDIEKVAKDVLKK
jgi:hypothetical protein